MSATSTSVHSRPGAGGGRSPLYRATIIVGTLGAALTVVAAQGIPLVLDSALPMAVLLAMGAASAGMRTRWAQEHVAFSFTGVAVLGALVLVGPLGAAVTGIGAAMLDARYRWSQDHLFNAAMIAFSAAVAAVVYRMLGGAFVAHGVLATRGPGGWEALGTDVLSLATGVLAPLLIADAALCLANLAVLLLLKAPVAGEVRSLLVGSLTYAIPLYLGYGVIAFILVVLWVPGKVGALAALLITAPLLVTRWIHTQYAEQQRSHRRILETLVDAGTGPQGVAHAARAREYADAVGASLGLRIKERHTLRYAVMLHGIGSATSCQFDSSGGASINNANGARSQVQTRAAAAHEIVSKVDFLADAATTILHQSERFDGSGGPAGLCGEDIPVLSRILAVADAADLLTAAAGGGCTIHEAVEILARHPDRFDPTIVAALGQALGPPERGVLEVDPPRGVAS